MVTGLAGAEWMVIYYVIHSTILGYIVWDAEEGSLQEARVVFLCKSAVSGTTDSTKDKSLCELKVGGSGVGWGGEEQAPTAVETAACSETWWGLLRFIAKRF